MSSEHQHDAGSVPPDLSSPDTSSSGPSTSPDGRGPQRSRRRLAATLLATLSLAVVALLTPFASAATTPTSDPGAATRAAAASRSAAASSSAAARRSTAAAPTTTVRPTTTTPRPTTTTPRPTTTTARPTTTTPRPTTTAPATTTTTTAPANDMLAQVLAITNQERAKNGCAALTRNAQLDSAAQQHSDYQAQTQTMSHTGRGGTDPGQRITAAGYQWSTYGENVAYGFTTAQDVMTAWMNSPGHRANILNCNFKEIGLGLGQPNYYWTQDFATKR